MHDLDSDLSFKLAVAFEKGHPALSHMRGDAETKTFWSKYLQHKTCFTKVQITVFDVKMTILETLIWITHLIC